MDVQEYVNSLIEKGRQAVESVADYTQEQADAMVKAVGKIIYDQAEVISREAAEETGMGTTEDKVGKHVTTAANTWSYLRGKASVGILEDDRVNNVVTIAKPMGVIAAVTPATNPTTTANFAAMNCLKSLNAVIVAPHPRAKNCSKHCVDLMRNELVKLGAPADLIQVLEEPTIEMSGVLMSAADAIIAVGGAGMVKASYSHGRPSFAVGQGNVQCLIDEDYPDLENAIATTIWNRTFDKGIPCTGDQVMYIPEKNKDLILDLFKAQNAYLIEDEATLDLVRQRLFDKNGINRDVVGQDPRDAFKAMGIEIPDCSVALAELRHGVGENDILCREILFPFIRFVVYDNFKDAVAMAKTNLRMEGAGHSSVIWSKNYDHITLAGLQLPVGRLMVEQPNGSASGVTDYNGLPPTMAIGCGTWGGNSISENLTYYHLLNKTKISYLLNNPMIPTMEELWA